MSEVIRERALELLWKQWTVLGVSGVPRRPHQGLDLEALIAFTPHVVGADPRLEEESLDWCARIGSRFVSVSRLRQILRMMPPTPDGRVDLSAVLIEKSPVTDRRLSGKSRPPDLAHRSLLQLRSRCVFGVGARADAITTLVMRRRVKTGERLSAIKPTGYTKQAAAAVLEELADAAVVKKLVSDNAVRYRLIRGAPLRTLLSPLPPEMPAWAERFATIADILGAWSRYGSRPTYAIELAKLVERFRSSAAKLGSIPATAGRPDEILDRINSWAVRLLEDDIWEDEWEFKGHDISHEILQRIEDDLVAEVQSGDYPVGLTELEQLFFRNIDRKKGHAEFQVGFVAEHPREEFSFSGSLDGEFRFDPAARTKEALFESIDKVRSRARFDIDDGPFTDDE